MFKPQIRSYPIKFNVETFRISQPNRTMEDEVVLQRMPWNIAIMDIACCKDEKVFYCVANEHSLERVKSPWTKVCIHPIQLYNFSISKISFLRWEPVPCYVLLLLHAATICDASHMFKFSLFEWKFHFRDASVQALASSTFQVDILFWHWGWVSIQSFCSTSAVSAKE